MSVHWYIVSIGLGESRDILEKVEEEEHGEEGGVHSSCVASVYT